MSETTVSQPSGLSHEKLIEALYFTYDLFSRVNIPFFLLDETAYNAKNRLMLEGDHITVGIRKMDYQPYTFATMQAVFQSEGHDNNHIDYNYNGTPILVKVIDSTEKMYMNLDTFLYCHEFFCVPNPFEEYWESRNKPQESIQPLVQEVTDNPQPEVVVTSV